MRCISILLGALLVSACSSGDPADTASATQRAASACAEVDSLCASSGDCLPKQAFCAQRFAALFVAEDGCITGCDGDPGCREACKTTRVNAMLSSLVDVDLDGDGDPGEGTTACADLDGVCASTGATCTAGEFFCATADRVASTCTAELHTCRAACTRHDRTCLRACRDAYKQCLATAPTDGGSGSGSGTDAGVPDSPPTTTTYDLTYGTTAGGTGTGTVSVTPAGTSCGAGCATYASGTAVTLTATASTGSSFTSWAGCTSTTNTCTVTLSQALTVTATFTLTPTTTGHTYTSDIAPKMAGLCNGCHGDATAPAGYRTDSYAGLLGNGSDGTPNVIPGDASSLLVQKIAGNHKNVLTLYPGFDQVVRDWVVLDKAAQ